MTETEAPATEETYVRHADVRLVEDLESVDRSLVGLRRVVNVMVALQAILALELAVRHHPRVVRSPGSGRPA